MKKIIFRFILVLILISLGFYLGNLMNEKGIIAEDLSLDDQEATIRAINKVIPAVVSILVYDQVEIVTINIETGKEEKIREKRHKGNGTGFIINSDGLILTNRHVVSAASTEYGEYKVILNSGKRYHAQLIDKDPIKDLAILKIYDKGLPYVELGDSDKLQVGKTVIAIGNTLGRYQNSVTKGIVSGLGRSLPVGGTLQALDNVIQTDAEISTGNSGGPLIDLEGKVVGINSAVDEEGSSIGFAIPVNDARPVIRSIIEYGRIIRPRMGVRYMMLTPEIAFDNKLIRDSGAWITKGSFGEIAVYPDSPAESAGLLEGDIIFEINAIKIVGANTLFSVVQKYKPGNKIGLKIQRGEEEIIKIITLDEFK